MPLTKCSARHPVDHDRPTGLIRRAGPQQSRDWVRCLNSGGGIELLEAEFERHVYERHIHQTYAIGITLSGVQRFWCRGATHDSTPGDVIAIAPGDAHDGTPGAPKGYKYRMFYVPLAILCDIIQDALERPATEFYADAPLVRDLALSQQLELGDLTLRSAHDLRQRYLGQVASAPQFVERHSELAT